MKKNPASDPVSSAEAVVARIKAQRESLQKKIQSYTFRWPALFIFCFIGMVFGVLIYRESYPRDFWLNPSFWYGAIPGGAATGAALYLLFLVYARTFLTMFQKTQDQLLTGAGIVNLQETLEEDFFTKLVKINFKYLDQYYLQTQSQANKSFRLSAAVASIALLIIIAGIVLMYMGKTEPAYISTAAGVLGEFIAAVFFYLYNRTITKMSEYHQKLVITQNISLALKIAEGLPVPDRTRAQIDLIQRLSQDCNKYLTQFGAHDDGK